MSSEEDLSVENLMFLDIRNCYEFTRFDTCFSEKIKTKF